MSMKTLNFRVPEKYKEDLKKLIAKHNEIFPMEKINIERFLYEGSLLQLQKIKKKIKQGS